MRLDWNRQGYYLYYYLKNKTDSLLSFGNKRSYEDFQKHIPNQIGPLFDSLRNFCLSLDNSVIEDVRMHRVVFSKSMIFRWFADIEPINDKVIIKIQKGRKDIPEIIEVRVDENIEKVTNKLQDAFSNIR